LPLISDGFGIERAPPIEVVPIAKKCFFAEVISIAEKLQWSTIDPVHEHTLARFAYPYSKAYSSFADVKLL